MKALLRSVSAFVVAGCLALGCGSGLLIGDFSSSSGKGPRTVSPGAVNGLRAWLRADSGITVSVGVSAWSDLSGSGNDFVQVSSIYQPAFMPVDGTFGGRPSVVFDGTDDFLQGPSDATFTNNAATWIAVFATDPAQTSGTVLTLGATGTSPYNDGWRLDVAQNGTISDQYVRAYAMSASAPVYTPDSLRYTLGAPNVAVGHWSQSQTYVQLFLNGVPSVPTALAPDVMSNLYQMRIGAHNFANAFFFKGKVAEVIVYNQAISSSDLQGVECYLQVRYGIPIAGC